MGELPPWSVDDPINVCVDIEGTDYTVTIESKVIAVDEEAALIAVRVPHIDPHPDMESAAFWFPMKETFNHGLYSHPPEVFFDDFDTPYEEE